MKRWNKSLLSVFLSLSLLAALAAASAPAAHAQAVQTLDIALTNQVDFYGNRDILQQYACKDGKTAKLISGRQLYRYDVASDSFEPEFTFPAQESINSSAGQVGTVSVYNGVQSAYISEASGKLYYAYDKYRKFNKADGMAVEVVTYDLEQGRQLSEFTVPGVNLSAVGADDDGRVFLGVRNNFPNYSTADEAAILLLSAAGTQMGKLALANPADTFCGFADSGKFFYAESVYTLNENNRYSVSRNMRSGTRSGNTLTQDAAVVSKLQYYYNQPGKLTGGVFANYTTHLYDAATAQQTAYYPGTPSTEEDYYLRHNTANTFISGNLIYVLAGSRSVMCYNAADGSLAGSYVSDKDVYSFVGCGSGLLLLTKSGSTFDDDFIAFDSFQTTEPSVLNLNEQPAYQRTPAEIVQTFAASVPKDYDAPFFEESGSAEAPYAAFTLTEETKENFVRMESYYRWLEGLSGFAAAEDAVWDNAAKGAVLTEKNVRLTGALSHYPEQPEDMDEAFYKAGYQATSTSNIAYGFSTGQSSILRLLRGFLNDEGYTVPGHRNTIMTRNGDRAAVGFSDYGAVNTILYTGSPNPQGASVIGNNQPAYAWPTPGCFPAEEISTTAVWSINLNTDIAGLSATPCTVKITDLQSGEEYIRDSNETGLYSSTGWGRFISFRPPTAASYSGKSYRVEVFNLADSNGLPLTLTYTVSFFSYGDEVEIDGVLCTADDKGVLTCTDESVLLGDADGDGRVNVSDVTEIRRYLGEYIDLPLRQKFAADVTGDGKVNVDDATKLQRYLAEYLTAL